jgi:hypothetical protein
MRQLNDIYVSAYYVSHYIITVCFLFVKFTRFSPLNVIYEYVFCTLFVFACDLEF